MPTVIGYFALFIALIIPNMAEAAFELNAKVNSGNVSWDNVILDKGKMVPVKWGIPPTLKTADSWVAATFSSAPPTSITLVGGFGSKSPPIPVSIFGVQYNTGGVKFTESSSGFGGGCSFDAAALPIVIVEGTSCVSSIRLNSTVNTTPFVYFRPVFKIDERDIVSALKGLPEGKYSASVPINIRFYYENHGIMTYRNIPEMVKFSFDYQPIQLDNITVIGDGIMDPVYNTITKRITSRTSFDITANGYFNDGIVLTMPTQKYELVNSVPGSGFTIPYNINCSQCAKSNLVDNGKLLNSTTTIAAGTGAQTSIDFSLNFEYDIDGSSAVSGDYFDEVLIMVEPGI
ncbi:hypothetical protein AB4279_07790 [Vibrio cyclitrophicus]